MKTVGDLFDVLEEIKLLQDILNGYTDFPKDPDKLVPVLYVDNKGKNRLLRTTKNKVTARLKELRLAAIPHFSGGRKKNV